MEHGQETIEVDDDSADEAERKRWAEVQIREQWVKDQMTRAQAESSKQATREFARAALAYWHS